MPRKENTKARSWERDRRERMNTYFKTLADLLPPYEDGRIRNKVDILTHTAEYIRNLHGQSTELFHFHVPDIHKEELSRLRKLVSQLYSRTQLLSALLKEAGIPIPAEPALDKISALKWLNKIGVEDGDKFFVKFEDKKRSRIKKKEKIVRNKVPSKRKAVTRSQNQPKKQINDSASKNLNKIENQENRVNSPDGDSESSNDDDSNTGSGITTNVSYTDIATSGIEVRSAVPGRNVNTESEKHDSPKKVKRKSGPSPKYKMGPRLNHTMANLASGTLIFSGAKLMPVVTPMAPLTPNIIVNAQTQSGNPIILSNGQQSQMIVMQHLTSPAQNSIIPVCNQTLINAVQKVTLNPMSAIQTNMVVSSHDWVSNVKSIINATKISGRKSILPKGREITKTTASYKVPIPAIHKEKIDRSKEATNKKDIEPKSKCKTAKTQKNNEDEPKTVDSANLKRTPSATFEDSEDPKLKKFKSNAKDSSSSENSRPAKTANDDDRPKDQATSTSVDEDTSKQVPTSLSSTETTSDATTTGSKSEQVSDSKESTENNPSVSTSSSATQTDQNDLERVDQVEDPPKLLPEEAPTRKDDVEDADSMCNLGPRFDTLLETNAKRPEVAESVPSVDNGKVILNLDTNTTTTVKPESKATLSEEESLRASKLANLSKDEALKALSYSADNSFIPINRSEALHSDLSNDIFASLQVPSSSHHPESISPTAAFLMAFPLVSSLNGKTEVLEDDLKEDFKYHSQTPPMLLQIGAMDSNSFKPKCKDAEPPIPDVPEKRSELVAPSCEKFEKAESITPIKQSVPTSKTNSEEKIAPDLVSTAQPQRKDDVPRVSRATGVVKALPKIVNSQNIKEQFKIVQTSIPPSLTTPLEVNNSFPRTSVTAPSISYASAVKDTHSSVPFSSASQPVVCSSSNLTSGLNSNFQIFEESRTRYPAQQNFMPNYPMSSNAELSHYTPPTFTSSVPKSGQQCHSAQKLASLNPQQTYSVQAKGSQLSTTLDQTKKHQNFGHNFSFEKTAVVNPQSHGSESAMFQPKMSNAQSYMPYNTDAKKMTTATPSIGKSVQYSSNYEHGLGDNGVKSTTTVAHNTSNFSILSWTTFSPNNANSTNTSNSNLNNGNNIVHYEHVPTVPQAPELTEHKTICDNFGYVPPTQKDNNAGFSNMLPDFPNDNGLLSVKRHRDVHKQPVSLPHNADARKQNENASIDYKFDGKSKGKYSIENSFPQGNFNMEQQTKHQGLPNNGKQEKANYMPNYNPQVSFNLPDSNLQTKTYATDNYPGANFKYNEKPQAPQKPTQFQTHHNGIEPSNSGYKQTQNGNKAPKSQQIGAPVNWMMTPEIKHNTNIPDIILPPIGKELEYCQNNLFPQNTNYNQTGANQFYNNYDVTHSFPNISAVQNELKKVDPFYAEEQPFSWSPTKNTHSVDKPIDPHLVPSTLPTLVGDLALGTNIPEKQSFLFGQMPTRLTGEKDLMKEKDSGSGRDYHAILNPQNGQGTFLSVSQLVEHEKAEKSQQIRKPQRKSTSPRGTGKRQMDARKQSGGLHHDEAKPEQNFPGQSYQHKYQQQNEVNWRNRNCKSNYTAESLIGTNTNVQDDGQAKHSAIKFGHSYPQNNSAMPIHYFPNSDDPNNYGQANQNFNYSYSNANIYPSSNFITSISNTPTTNFITNISNTPSSNFISGISNASTSNFMTSISNTATTSFMTGISNTPATNFMTSISNAPTTYMMPSQEAGDYLEQNTFLLPNAHPVKSQHYGGKPQTCEKRSYTAPKRSKRKTDMTQSIEFNAPLEDYHTSFLPHGNLYQNSPQVNSYTKAVNNPPGLTMTANQNTGLPMNPNTVRGSSTNSHMVMTHPSGTSLTNFNLSTIFPEINDKVVGYKPSNSMTQPSTHGPNYVQRTNYSNTLGLPPQVSESAQFANNMPPSSSVHYKNT